MTMTKTMTASIATNDPANDPTPRVTLTRTERDGRYIWVDPEGGMVADGRTIAEANSELRWRYNFAGWDLKFGRARP